MIKLDYCYYTLKYTNDDLLKSHALLNHTYSLADQVLDSLILYSQDHIVFLFHVDVHDYHDYYYKMRLKVNLKPILKPNKKRNNYRSSLKYYYYRRPIGDLSETDMSDRRPIGDLDMLH